MGGMKTQANHRRSQGSALWILLVLLVILFLIWTGSKVVSGGNRLRDEQERRLAEDGE